MSIIKIPINAVAPRRCRCVAAACLVLILVFLALSTSALAAPSQAASAWAQHCERLKQRVLAAPQASIVYSPLPDESMPISSAVWRLDWHGEVIPLPALTYHNIGFLGHADTAEGTAPGVMLVTRDRQFVSVGRAVALRDVGTKNSLFDVLLKEYSLTPADLHCDAPPTRTSREVAQALILKAMASPAVITAAHRLSGRRSGLLRQGRHATGMRVYDYLFAVAGLPLPIHLRYRLANKISGVGLLAATPNNIEFAAGPGWLSALQAYLDGPDTTTRCALAQQLSLANFRPANITALLRGHAACPMSTEKNP